MVHILVALLIFAPGGDWEGLQDVVRWARKPGIWTTSQEVIMADMAAVIELQPTDRRKSQDVENDQGRDAPPNGDVLMQRILENLNVTSQEEVLKRIASLPDIRQGKVLSIRRHITDGTYEVADRLDRAMDRILEAITA
jgi:anti-sigma28 factor (negative regulator of flagellin synthesis)